MIVLEAWVVLGGGGEGWAKGAGGGVTKYVVEYEFELISQGTAFVIGGPDVTGLKEMYSCLSTMCKWLVMQWMYLGWLGVHCEGGW